MTLWTWASPRTVKIVTNALHYLYMVVMYSFIYKSLCHFRSRGKSKNSILQVLSWWIEKENFISNISWKYDCFKNGGCAGIYFSKSIDIFITVWARSNLKIALCELNNHKSNANYWSILFLELVEEINYIWVARKFISTKLTISLWQFGPGQNQKQYF